MTALSASARLIGGMAHSEKQSDRLAAARAGVVGVDRYVVYELKNHSRPTHMSESQDSVFRILTFKFQLNHFEL